MKNIHSVYYIIFKEKVQEQKPIFFEKIFHGFHHFFVVFEQSAKSILQFGEKCGKMEEALRIVKGSFYERTSNE